MIDTTDRRLIEAVQAGLPLTSRPYAEVARQVGLSEAEVIARLGQLQQQGLIKRFGVIVNHRELGYRANAMVVMDVADQLVEHLGREISQHDFVNLCYRRPRRGNQWPYNLYFMVHGKSRETVMDQLELLSQDCRLGGFRREVLFSRRCFKQRGAVYRSGEDRTLQAAHG